MSQRICVFLLVAISMVTISLWAQQPCPSFSIAVNSDEDTLMLAVNGADSPKDQIAALDKFAQEHADSKFTPCVNEYEAAANLKLKDYDKSMEYAEKDLALNYQDLNLLLTLMRAYASSTKVSDTIPSTGCRMRYTPKHRYATPTSNFQTTLPAPCEWKATTTCTTPAKTMSQAITTFTATAATSGDPTASMPRMISKTPHTIDHVEACRTTSDEFPCAI